MRSSCNEVDKLIGEKISILRRFCKISSRQLGEKIGVSLQQVAKYEKGTNRISASKLILVAQVLKKDISCFYEGLSDEAESSDEDQCMHSEVSRDFLRISNIDHRTHIRNLVKSLANENNYKKKVS